MRKMKRAIHIDFHTMPKITDFGENFNAEDFAKTLEDAHVDYVNVFARCNVGFSYYPTEVGIPYPHMKGNMLGDIIKECHKRDIGVTAYFNAGLHHEILIRHPEYLRINKNGTAYKDLGENMNFNYFRRPCFNSGYTDHLLKEIEEVLKMDPDGIFCDCFASLPCYCPTCVKMMTEQGISFEDDDAVAKFSYETLHRTVQKIRALVPKDKRLILNSHPHEDFNQYNSHAELECLPSGSWGYDYLTTQAPYYRKLSPNPVYMTGRFTLDWGDFGGKKSKTSMEYDVQDALLYGFAPSIGDHMHPRDGLDKKLYKDIGDMFSYVVEMEKYTDGTTPMVEAAILRNKIHYNTSLCRFNDSDKGASRMLAELKICYDIINEDMDFDGYKLLVLPDYIEITDKLKKKLESFKGSILTTGKSISEGSIWSYISEFEKDTNTHGFYEKDGDIRGQYLPSVKMKSDFSIVPYVEPYFNSIFDGVHAYYYVPPKGKSDFSVVAECGNKAHICFDIFAAYMKFGAHFHKELVKDILSRLLPERLIDAKELPAYSRATRFDGENCLLNIKLTYPEAKGSRGCVEDVVSLPHGRKVSVSGKFKNVYSLPDLKEIPCTIIGERTEITLPQIDGFLPMLLK